MSVDGNSTSFAMPDLEIYTDRGCEPNLGPGGYGLVLLHLKKRAETSAHSPNARMVAPESGLLPRHDEVVWRHDNDDQRFAKAAGGVARRFLQTEENQTRH